LLAAAFDSLEQHKDFSYANFLNADMKQNTATNNKIRIAIADDHIILRKGLCELINKLENCSIILEASNGKDLLDKLSGQEPLPDILILDVNMPVMNGYDALVAVKAKWPRIKVIILTMLDDEYTMLRMLKSGANGFLLKHCDGDDFLKAIMEVHNGGYFFPGFLNYDDSIRKVNKLDLPSISGRQLEYLALCASDLNYAKIAEKMGISVRSVESIQERLTDKLKISTRLGLVVFAIKTGLITI